MDHLNEMLNLGKQYPQFKDKLSLGRTLKIQEPSTPSFIKSPWHKQSFLFMGVKHAFFGGISGEGHGMVNGA